MPVFFPGAMKYLDKFSSGIVEAGKFVLGEMQDKLAGVFRYLEFFQAAHAFFSPDGYDVKGTRSRFAHGCPSSRMAGYPFLPSIGFFYAAYALQGCEFC